MQAPLYGERERDIILRFLAACLIDFQKGLDRSVIMAGDKRDQKPFAGVIQYWEHAVAVTKMLGYRAVKRQKHLLLFDESELLEIKKQWQSH